MSFVAATLAVRLISDLHGYQVTPVESGGWQSCTTFRAAIVVAVEGILNMYGGDFVHISKNSLFGPDLGGLPMAAGVALAAVHLVGVGLAVWGLFRAFRYFFDPDNLVSPSWPRRSSSTSPPTRSASFPAACSTPGRSWPCCPSAPSWRGAWSPGRWGRLPRRLKPALACASAAVLACYLAGLGYGAAQSPVADNEQAVIPWLEAHHLTSGIGTYVEANLITMDSGGRVAIREVAWLPAGDVPRSFESKASWYDPRQSYANFILTNSAEHWAWTAAPIA